MARTEAPATITQDVPAGQRRKTLAELEATRKDLLGRYANEPREVTQVSPFYAGHFGNVMTININTVVVRVRINGSPQSIPVTFADEVRRRVMEVDKQLRRAQKLSNVEANFEHTPGELTLY